MKSLVLLAALVCGPALAQGVNLNYLPAPTLTPADQTAIAAMQARPFIGAVVVTGLNPAAIDSTTVNVTIAGTVYQFVGTKTNSAEQPNVDLFKGAGPGGATLTVARYIGKMQGSARVGNKRYDILQINTAVGVTVEVKPIPVND